MSEYVFSVIYIDPLTNEEREIKTDVGEIISKFAKEGFDNYTLRISPVDEEGE